MPPTLMAASLRAVGTAMVLAGGGAYLRTRGVLTPEVGERGLPAQMRLCASTYASTGTQLQRGAGRRACCVGKQDSSNVHLRPFPPAPRGHSAALGFGACAQEHQS
jgi:hypothetical protein